MHRTTVILFTLLCVNTQLFADTLDTNDARDQRASNNENEGVNFMLRLGEGGFRDSRSPENKLGGGQIALDIQPKALPFAFSISSEYYTNSANPTHSYEISDLIAVNILYDGTFENIQQLNYFLGGGIGRLKVPRDSDPDSRATGDLVNFEAGLNYIFYKNAGVYSVLKYLHAEKSENNIKVIDFDELILLLGLTLSFGF